MKDFLKHLNKQQYDAATTINGPLLIIAGAGSGKTMTLVSRVANMIDEGISPDKILLLTFTNKAAKEMKNRIIKNIGLQGNEVTACTFHSFCALFLRRHAHLLGMDNNFTIIDGPDAGEVMGIVKNEFITKQKEKGILYDAKDFPNKKIISALYSISVNNCVKLSEVVLENGYELYYDEIKEIVKLYIEYKKAHAFFDYDDLLLYTKRILENFDTVREEINKKYMYVSCDEFQDTNIVQDEILKYICEKNRNLAVVGDDNQSIYKFRGARIENILSFEKKYPDCKKIVLYENYRSSQEILDLANSTMSYATEGIEKKLHGQFSAEKPKIVITQDNNEENEYILKEIKNNYSNGVPLREMAIIVRNSAQSYGIESLLDKNDIPYDKFGGIKFLEKSIVRDILSFLRVTINEKDEIALYRILQLYPGIGKGYSGKITNAVATDGLSSLNNLYVKSKFHQFLSELYETIKTLKMKTLKEQLSYIMEDYYPMIAERSIVCSKINDSEKMEAIQKVYHGIDDAKTLYDMAEGYRLAKDFLEDIVLDSTTKDEEDDRLNITTIHSAKGLEYDIVFIMDVVEQITPRCNEHDEEDAEELRCMYVALTRARKKLFLFAPKSHRAQPYMIYNCILSHFLNKDDILECCEFNTNQYQVNSLRQNLWDIY